MKGARPYLLILDLNLDIKDYKDDLPLYKQLLSENIPIFKEQYLDLIKQYYSIIDV